MANKESTTPFNRSNQIAIEKHRLCVQYSKFSNFGWEHLYKQYKSNVIKMINIDNNLSRLYIIRQLDLSLNNFAKTIADLKFDKQIQLPEIKQLINNLKDMFPDSDPIYLDLLGEYYGFNEIDLSIIVESMISKDMLYPKLSDYNDYLKTMSIINNLTVDFTVETFLNLCPDPVNYFKNVKFNSSGIHFQETLSYLCHKFNEISVTSIRTYLYSYGFNLTNTVEALSNNHNVTILKNKRKTVIRPYQVNFKTTENVEFLKEAAFNDHKEEILNYINTQKINREIKFEKAKSIGNLSTCECCFDDELLTTEVYSCSAGHNFCAPCINKGTEIAISSNKINLECLAHCNEEFNITIIKDIVDDKLFQRLMRLRQIQEIKEADIEGLETCAFCDYSVILPPDLKIIQCLNPDCGKKTCRDCREESHLPYKCDEVEKTPELHVRLMIENKMTEVLVRTCYYCNNKFVKEDGCNKMTCPCGSQMCYICRKPVGENYTHFYHENKIENACPLYTNENLVHSIAVEAAARLTVAELKASRPELLNKIDINKILPEFKKTNNINDFPNSSVSEVNEFLAKILGQNIEDINNLKDMRFLEPQPKKKRV